MDITVKKKVKTPKYTRRNATCTENEMNWTKYYYFGDEETKGNYVESYRKAYPQSSENTALAHAHKMPDRPGVKYAYNILYEEHKTSFAQTLAECKDFPEQKEMLDLLAVFMRNPVDMNGNAFCTKKLQMEAIKTGLTLTGAFERKISNEDDIGQIEINISTNDKKLQEPARQVLDARFNE